MKIFLILFYLSISLQAVSLDIQNVFIDDNGKQMWQDDVNAKQLKTSWDEAKSYCNALEFQGYNDWKLPDINALERLYENRFLLKYKVKNPYWSSVPDATDEKQAAHVDFCNGNTQWDIKSESFFVRCVRDTF